MKKYILKIKLIRKSTLVVRARVFVSYFNFLCLAEREIEKIVSKSLKNNKILTN
jgi:hypothetical protein